MSPEQRLRRAIVDARDGHAVPVTVLVLWNTDGPAPREQGPIDTSMTVHHRGGSPSTINFEIAGVPEYDARTDVSTWAPSIEIEEARFDNGERCVIVPLTVNGKVVNERPSAAAASSADTTDPIPSTANNFAGETVSVDVAWLNAVTSLITQVRLDCEASDASRIAFADHLDAIDNAATPVAPKKQLFKRP